MEQYITANCTLKLPWLSSKPIIAQLEATALSLTKLEFSERNIKLQMEEISTLTDSNTLPKRMKHLDKIILKLCPNYLNEPETFSRLRSYLIELEKEKLEVKLIEVNGGKDIAKLTLNLFLQAILKLDSTASHPMGKWSPSLQKILDEILLKRIQDINHKFLAKQYMDERKNQVKSHAKEKREELDSAILQLSKRDLDKMIAQAIQKNIHPHPKIKSRGRPPTTQKPKNAPGPGPKTRPGPLKTGRKQTLKKQKGTVKNSKRNSKKSTGIATKK